MSCMYDLKSVSSVASLSAVIKYIKMKKISSKNKTLASLNKIFKRVNYSSSKTTIEKIFFSVPYLS